MIDIIKFSLFVVLVLFFPGKLFLRLLKSQTTPIVENLLALVFGVILLTIIDWLFGYLGIRFVTQPLFIFIGLFGLVKIKPKLVSLSIPRFALIPLAAIVVGALFQVILMVKSGWQFNDGISFWGVHGYDAVWHMALIQELTINFPPQNPGFAGEMLKNYHYFFDLFLSIINRFTGISILDLYFRLYPILFAIILNSLVYIFAKEWSKSHKVALWSIFFTSIAGSFGWVPQLIGKGSNNWETAFWGMQPTSAFLNPPFAISLVFLMVDLILLNEFFKKNNRFLAILTILISGILAGFKIYAGIIVIASLAVMGIIRLFRRKIDLLVMAILSGVIALIVYLPTGAGSANYLVWQPWWFIKTMIEAPDRLNWSSLELRRQVYAVHNNWRNIFLLQSMAFMIFLVGNLGMRFVGFISIFRKLKEKKEIDLFLITLLIFAFFPPIFFTQKVIPWNTIQFLYYFTFLFSFFGAQAIVEILEKTKYKIFKILTVIFVVSMVMPSTIKTIWWFIAPTPTTLLYNKEIEALNFLKKSSKPSDILLTFPHNPDIQRTYNNPPVPMTYYNSTYVSFFTARRVYLEDLNAATILSYDIGNRLNAEKQFYETMDNKTARQFLIYNKISYIYLVDTQKFMVIPEEIGVEAIFNNEKVRIYKVNDNI